MVPECLQLPQGMDQMWKTNFTRLTLTSAWSRKVVFVYFCTWFANDRLFWEQLLPEGKFLQVISLFLIVEEQEVFILETLDRFASSGCTFSLLRKLLEVCGTPWKRLPSSLDLESCSWLHSATLWHGEMSQLKLGLKLNWRMKWEGLTKKGRSGWVKDSLTDCEQDSSKQSEPSSMWFHVLSHTTSWNQFNLRTPN